MPIQTDRLLRLADFLETRLPRAKWNFGVLMKIGEYLPAEALLKGEQGCGTVGCALGWTPAALPEVASWRANHIQVGNQTYGSGNISELTFALFGLNKRESEELFMPRPLALWEVRAAPYPDLIDSQLTADATPQEVAAHIREFVARIDSISDCDERNFVEPSPLNAGRSSYIPEED